MSTVIHKIDRVCRMLREAGNPEKFEGVHTTLMQAKGRIAHLEAQLAATETMRDRVAVQLLGDVLVGKLVHNGLNSRSCIQYAYRLADEVMLVRVEEPAALVEEQIASGQPATPAQVPGEFVDVRFAHGLEDGWYEAKFPGKDHWVSGSWPEIHEDIKAAGLVGRWVGRELHSHYRPEGLRD